jgi:hypothetical protein
MKKCDALRLQAGDLVDGPGARLEGRAELRTQGAGRLVEGWHLYRPERFQLAAPLGSVSLRGATRTAGGSH